MAQSGNYFSKDYILYFIENVTYFCFILSSLFLAVSTSFFKKRKEYLWYIGNSIFLISLPIVSIYIYTDTSSKLQKTLIDENLIARLESKQKSVKDNPQRTSFYSYGVADITFLTTGKIIAYLDSSGNHKSYIPTEESKEMYEESKKIKSIIKIYDDKAHSNMIWLIIILTIAPLLGYIMGKRWKRKLFKEVEESGTNNRSTI